MSWKKAIFPVYLYLQNTLCSRNFQNVKLRSAIQEHSVIGSRHRVSSWSREVYISWPHETHSLALAALFLRLCRQQAPVETITRLVMILTRSCWFGAWVSIFTPQGKFLFKQQPNFVCYLRKILNLDDFWWKNCCYLTFVFCVNYGHRHLDAAMVEFLARNGQIYNAFSSNCLFALGLMSKVGFCFQPWDRVKSLPFKMPCIKPKSLISAYLSN